MQIKDKVAVITGAANGIGEALARRFHKEGARAIVVCDNVGHFPKSFVAFLDFVRRPANGFVSTLLPLRGGTELSVKT